VTQLAVRGPQRPPCAASGAAPRSVTAAPSPAGRAADRALQDALIALDEVATAARAGLFSAPGADASRARSRQVGDLGWALLGARVRGDDDPAAAVATYLRRDLVGDHTT
jgi:hypothetical protein